MAARVASQLKKENDVDVQTASGGLGEFRVDVDGKTVVDTNRFWYPTTKGVVGKVKAALFVPPLQG